MGDLLEQLHALVVLDALGLHRGDGLAARLELLLRRGSAAGRRASPRRSRSCRARRSGDSGSSSSNAASANGDSGWLSAKFGCRSTVRRMTSGHPVASTARRRRRRAACGRSRARGGRARAVAATARGCRRPARACSRRRRRRGDHVEQHRVVICMCERERLGLGVDELAGTTARPTRRSPRAPSCARSCASSSGRRRPSRRAERSRSRARAPARRRCRRCRSRRGRRGPAIWWNSRALSCRIRVPSNFVSAVSSTVRIGTLMPTPSVSVPQMTRSSPRCASCSTRRRYFGSMPAWCTPMPERMSRDERLAERGREAELADRARRSRRAARGWRSSTLDSACARSSAAACEKCTM